MNEKLTAGETYTNQSYQPIKSNENTPMDEKVFSSYGYGLYTWKNIMYISLVLFIAGFNLPLFAYMTIPLQEYYNMDDNDMKIVSSVVYAGICIGSIVTGIISQKMYRNNLIKIYILIVLLSNILMALVKNLFLISFLRFLIGYSVGSLMPTSISLITEYLLVKYRSLVLSYIFFGFRVGQLVLLFIILEFMPNYEIENTQTVLLILPIFALGVLVFSHILDVKESPRALMLKDNEDESIKILERYKGMQLTIYEKNEFITEVKYGVNFRMKGSYIDIFRNQYCYPTVLLILLGVNYNMVFGGILLIASYTLKDIQESSADSDNANNSIIKNLIYTVLIGLVAVIISGPLSEMKSLGRKGTLILMSVFSLIFLLLCVFWPSIYFLWYGLALSFIGMGFNHTGNYTCEVYPTIIRDKAVGVIYAFGYLGAFASQIIYISLYAMDMWLPYYFSFGIILFNVILVLFLPYETLGQSLDHDYSKTIIELKTFNNL